MSSHTKWGSRSSLPDKFATQVASLSFLPLTTNVQLGRSIIISVLEQFIILAFYSIGLGLSTIWWHPAHVHIEPAIFSFSDRSSLYNGDALVTANSCLSLREYSLLSSFGLLEQREKRHKVLGFWLVVLSMHKAQEEGTVVPKRVRLKFKVY